MTERSKTERGLHFSVRSVIIAAMILFAYVHAVYAPPPEVGREAPSQKISVTVDPANKKNITGFSTIGMAIGSTMRAPRGMGAGMINLKEAMNRWTRVSTQVGQQERLSSPGIFNTPFIYIAFEGGFDLTGSESDILKQYLSNGGFVVIEQFVATKEAGSTQSAFSRMLLPVLGSGTRITPLSNNHPVYHSFFDFSDGPPHGGDMKEVIVGTKKGPGGETYEMGVAQKEVNYLEGITMNGRLVGICSSKKYLEKWQERSNNEPQLRMGVNMIVFALTQPGGMALR